jgi:zinc transport system substrate-binding protein
VDGGEWRVKSGRWRVEGGELRVACVGRGIRMKRSDCCLLCVLFLVVGCGRQREPEGSAEDAVRPVVYTTFYPTEYFVERIGGGHVDVVCPVPDDADAIFWTPDDVAIWAYQQADLIVLNGAGFSKWVGKVSLPESRIVDSAAALSGSFIQFGGAKLHSHGPTGEHAHEGVDGHTWVDPVNAIAQAGAIRDALSTRWPAWKVDFERGYAELVSDLKALSQRLAAFRDMPGSPRMLASHPAYNYIARRYGWNMENLDLDPMGVPSVDAVAAIRARLDRHPATYLIWESEPSREVADHMRSELGLASIVFSPCELLAAVQRNAGEDYLSVMRGNLARLSIVFEEGE